MKPRYSSRRCLWRTAQASPAPINLTWNYGGPGPPVVKRRKKPDLHIVPRLQPLLDHLTRIYAWLTTGWNFSKEDPAAIIAELAEHGRFPEEGEILPTIRLLQGLLAGVRERAEQAA